MPAIHPGYPTSIHLHPVMYWGDKVGERPQDFVDSRVPASRREALAFIFKNGIDAHPGVQAKGWASCRICGALLGSMDLARFGFVWPQKAEHYVLAHGVWTPECSALLERALAPGATRVGAAPASPPPGPQQAPKELPWYFEKTGPAFFNEWSLAHVGWGVVWQLLFPGRLLAGLVVHTIYESIEGYIFPAEFRDVSMRNHVGDTIAFAAGTLVVPPTRKRSAADTTQILAEASSRSSR